MSSTINKSGTGTLALAALGVVYGDIGTSPLYAFKEAFSGVHAMALTEVNVLATLSALFWAVMLIISIKYVFVVLSFDNKGEGGVLALTALAQRFTRAMPRWSPFIMGAGVFAAALFYGDAIITPAISVLSAVEGLSVVTPRFEQWVVPITVGILIGLFMIQRHGTSRVGKLFGPITVLWFVLLGTFGVMSIIETPSVLQALNPYYALHFAFTQPGAAFLLLSAVFLALTGGEALYADMGHFGARVVRMAWYWLVCPALVLNYFGQGALVLRDHEAARNPFYFLVPEGMLLPLVILATVATVIASQATITGAYSMTLQAVRLNFLPRIRILHTSDTERGQIYIPSVNWAMLVAVIILVVQFASSGALAAAYGIAVSGTMIITTVLLLFLMFVHPSRRRTPVMIALMMFLVLEMSFFASNLTKIASGGWLPLLLGIIIFTFLTTWKVGTRHMAEQRRAIDIPIKDFLAMPQQEFARVPGTAIYLTSDPTLVPSALFHNLKHYHVLHERVIFLNMVKPDAPYIDPENRLEVEQIGPEVYNVAIHFGFREQVDLPVALEGITRFGLELNPMSTTYFLTRTTVIDGVGGMPHWRAAIFGWMNRQSESGAAFFRLPPNRVVELGTQLVV